MARGSGRVGGGRGGGGRGDSRGRPAVEPAEANAAVLRMDLDEAEPQNAEHYLEVRNALERINGATIFREHPHRAALGITAGDVRGAQAPVSQEHSIVAISNHGE